MFGERENRPMSKKANPAALLPILVFLVLYLGLGLIFEYVLKIPMGFYSIPIVVIFLIALLVACCQNRALSFDEKLTLMGRGVGDKNIITMLLIFLCSSASWAAQARRASRTSCSRSSRRNSPWRCCSS